MKDSFLIRNSRSIIFVTILFFVVGVALHSLFSESTLSANSAAQMVEVAALPVSDNYFETGFVTPASCSSYVPEGGCWNEYDDDEDSGGWFVRCNDDDEGGGGPIWVDNHHPEFGGACRSNTLCWDGSYIEKPGGSCPPPPMADLTPLPDSGFTISDTSPDVGDTVTMCSNILNVGNGNSGSFDNRFEITPDQVWDGWQISGVNAPPADYARYTGVVAGLVSGASRVECVDWVPDTAGTFYVRIRVDNNENVPESNEVNNRTNFVPIVVSTPPPPAQCEDGADNFDPEDALADANDPGCYTSGSYDPNDDDETDTLPECSNNFDDDGDGLIDEFDEGCNSGGSYDSGDDSEADPSQPDLTIVSTFPADGASFGDTDDVTFTGTLTNSGAAPTAAGETIWMDLEIDWGNADCSTASADEMHNAGGGSEQLASGNTLPVSSLRTAAQLQAGDHCYRFVADQADFVAEGDNTNNTTPWRAFSVIATPSVTLQACDGGGGSCVGGSKTIDPGDGAQIRWTTDADECEKVGGPASFAVSSAGNPGPAIDGVSEPAEGTGETYTLRCRKTSGPWSPNESVTINTNWSGAPSVTFKACELGSGVADLNDVNKCSDPRSVPVNTDVTLVWDSPDADDCTEISGAGFMTGGSVAGTDDVTINASSMLFELVCTKTSNPNSTSSEVLVTSGNGPSISADPGRVRLNEPFDIDWNTGDSNANECTISGGSPSGNLPTVAAPDSGIAQDTIAGETTYTITCPFGSDSVTVELIPGVFET